MIPSHLRHTSSNNSHKNYLYVYLLFPVHSPDTGTMSAEWTESDTLRRMVGHGRASSSGLSRKQEGGVRHTQKVWRA